MDDHEEKEPEGAVFLRILAAAMITDRAHYSSGRFASWRASRKARAAGREAHKYAGLGSDPAALEYLNQEITVQLADMTLRTTELAKAMASDFAEFGRLP